MCVCVRVRVCVCLCVCVSVCVSVCVRTCVHTHIHIDPYIIFVQKQSIRSTPICGTSQHAIPGSFASCRVNFSLPIYDVLCLFFFCEDTAFSC